MFLTFRYASFDTNLILWEHPQQVFYDSKNHFLKIFGKSIIVWIFCMFLHHPSKFGEFSLKIGGEIICQSWPLLTPFFNFCIVQWGFKCKKNMTWNICISCEKIVSSLNICISCDKIVLSQTILFVRKKGEEIFVISWDNNISSQFVRKITPVTTCWNSLPNTEGLKRWLNRYFCQRGKMPYVNYNGLIKGA